MGWCGIKDIGSRLGILWFRYVLGVWVWLVWDLLGICKEDEFY